MIYEQNPLTGSWLCYAPKTPIAYYMPSKRQAIALCNEFNALYTVVNGEIRQKTSNNNINK